MSQFFAFADEIKMLTWLKYFIRKLNYGFIRQQKIRSSKMEKANARIGRRLYLVWAFLFLLPLLIYFISWTGRPSYSSDLLERTFKDFPPSLVPFLSSYKHKKYAKSCSILINFLLSQLQKCNTQITIKKE